MKKLTPVIYTIDLEGTITFYKQVLGFVCVDFDEDSGFARIETEGIDIMLSHPNEHIPFEKPNFTGSFYFTVDNVAELWSRCKDSQEIAYPLEKFDYGMKEFALYDNNGYLLQFGEPINR